MPSQVVCALPSQPSATRAMRRAIRSLLGPMRIGGPPACSGGRDETGPGPGRTPPRNVKFVSVQHLRIRAICSRKWRTRNCPRNLKHLELRLSPAEADRQSQTSASNDVERCHLLGNLDWVVEREDDKRVDIHAIGLGGGPGEERDVLKIGIRCREIVLAHRDRAEPGGAWRAGPGRVERAVARWAIRGRRTRG